MDIQSIYSATKTTQAASASTDDDTAPGNGFAALLDLAGTRFKAAFGIEVAETSVFKKDPSAVRASEPRETRPRGDERDAAKARPAKDERDSDKAAADETTAAAGRDSQSAEAGAQGEAAETQAVVQAVAADASLIVQAAPDGVPAATAETVVAAAPVTAVQTGETVMRETLAATPVADSAEAVAAPKTATAETAAKGETAAAESAVKEAVRPQQTVGTPVAGPRTAPTESIAAAAETVSADAKAAKDADPVRAADPRTAAAQEQASSLARLLGAENRIQVQVNVTPAHAVRQAAPDVSVYNIYAGYTAAEAMSLANGQFGQDGAGNALTGAAKPADPQAQTAAAVPAEPLPGATGGTSAGTSTGAAAARAEGGVAVAAVQAAGSTGGAASANLGFNAFAGNGAGQAQQAQQTQSPASAERPAATANQVIDQIKVNITKAAKAGLDRVTIQLKPVELGRIEIKLEMSEDHKVRVTVTADNKDTLALLQTDARALERTLNDAGLRTDANNLHFNLRGDGDAAASGKQGGGDGGSRRDAGTDVANDNDDPAYDYTAAASARGGVDTFA